MGQNYTPLNISHKDHEAVIPHAKNHHIGLRAAIFSIFILLIIFVYNVMQMETMSLRVWNRSFANAGMILIGLSFALSGLCYFFNTFDTKILYRRDLGLNGFYFVALHGIYSLFFNRFITWNKYFESDRLLGFIPALISLLIFFTMALVSNKVAAKKLGADRWRTILRIGYVALILGAVHAGLWSYEEWIGWAGTSPLPPISLVVTVFVCIVVFLRIALWIALSKKAIKK